MENSLLKKRTIGLDVLKYLSCFLVILAHVEFPGKIDEYTILFCRTAVPAFFMITGYFYTQTRERKRETKQIKKVFVLFLVANLLYAVWMVAKLVMAGKSVAEYVKGFLNWRTLIEFLFFNQSPHKNSVWYLSALLYALVVLWLVGKKISLKKLYPLIPVLLAINLVLGAYSEVIFGCEISVVYSRNFIFYAIPYILLGDFMYNNKDKFSKTTSLILVPVFLATTLAEYFILSRGHESFVREHFISSFFLTFCLFNLFLKCESSMAGKSFFEKIAGYGQKYTLVIYIVHSIIIDFWIKGFDFITSRVEGVSLILNCLEPIAVLIASTIFAWLFSIVESKVKRKAKSN